MATLKIKRSRARLHITAPKSSKTTKKDNEKYDITEMTLDNLPTLQLPLPIPEEFIRKDSFVSLEGETKDETNYEQATKERLKKKDRRKLRHNQWMEKIQACYQKRQEDKETEKRKKTVIVGDLQPLLSALKDIELITTDNQKRQKKGQQLPSLKSTPKQSSSIYVEREKFKQVLTNPFYKVDPQGTILEIVKQNFNLNY